jgi:Flp pilus assembly protein protease CpaA
MVGVCVLAAALVGAVTDFKWQRIPNFITYSTFLWVLALKAVASIGAPPVTQNEPVPSVQEISSAATPPSASDLLVDGRWRRIVTSISLADSLGGGLGCFLIMVSVYRASGGGAGDVKLAAALGAGLGVERGLSMLIWTYAIAGTLMLVIVCVRSGPFYFLKATLRSVASVLAPGWAAPPSDEQRAFLRTPVPLGPSFAIGTLIASLGGNLLEGRLGW